MTGWPQMIVGGWLVLGVLGAFALDGKERPPYRFADSLLTAAVLAMLLRAGGFWE